MKAKNIKYVNSFKGKYKTHLVLVLIIFDVVIIIYGLQISILEQLYNNIVEYSVLLTIPTKKIKLHCLIISVFSPDIFTVFPV